jgi:hypothetical protein
LDHAHESPSGFIMMAMITASAASLVLLDPRAVEFRVLGWLALSP